MTKKQEKEKARQEALMKLREWIRPGDTVWTVLRYRSRSGMQRSISVVVMTPEGPYDASWAVARALDWRFDRERDGVKVNGCGMDMGFHLVYSLSYVMFPKGFGCVGEARCHSNDHSNGDRDYTPHGTVYALPHPTNDVVQARPPVEHWRRDGGYALKQRWL